MENVATDVEKLDTGPETAQKTRQGKRRVRQPSSQPRCEYITPGGRNLCRWDVVLSAT